MKAEEMTPKKTTTKQEKLEKVAIHSFKQNRPPLAQRTKLQKAEARAIIMLGNEQREKDRHATKQFQDYVERKVLKGHDIKTANNMAKAMFRDRLKDE